MSNRLNEELKRELSELKNNDLTSSKEEHYQEVFDSMSEMIEVIELIYDENNKPKDLLIIDVNISFAKHLKKTKNQLINKKMSSVVGVLEDYWLTSFASVDKTGQSISFKNYGGEFKKYYFVSAWKISKKRIGVSFTDITESEKAEIELKESYEKERIARRKTNHTLLEKELELYHTIDDLDAANKKLAFQWEEKDKRAKESVLANKEKAKRADELAIANLELAFQNKEKDNRADELVLANTELAFQNEEKEKRADELAIANTELAFQNEEKEKRADELILANTELAFQNGEKEKRADELAIANTELAFQNEEKEKRANELAIANTELAFQNEEKEKRANELILANTELAFQNEEKEKRADELAIANKELAFQNKEKEKRADELAIAKKELIYQKKLDTYRSEAERVALELTLLIDTANAPIFGIDSKGLVNEWNQTSEKITGFKKDEVLGKKLVQTYITKDYRKSVKKVLDDALLGKETANYEFPLFSKDGERVMVLLNSSTRRDSNGKIIGVLGVGQDISEMDKLRTVSESIAKELRQFIETANAPIFGIDSKGLVNEWNQTSEKITGFKKNDVFGKNLVQTYITEDYRESVKKVLDDALIGMETANYEFPLFTKNGERVMVLLNSSSRRDANGKIIGVLGVGQDISEMDKLRTVSESIAKELRQFIETANAPIFGIDSKGLVNEWNQTSEKITGFKKNDVFGKNLVQTYITEDYRESVKKVLDDALIGMETANYEFPLFTKNGERVMVLLNSSSRRDANGKIIGVLGVGQDISEMDKLRTVSESIAEELRRFIETANAPIFGIDSKGLVNEWNQTSEKITGFKKNDVFGKNLVQTYITEDYRESVKKVLDDALIGMETANYEFPLFTKNGARVMVLLNSSSRRDANGKIIGVLGVGQDISEMDKLRTVSESIAEELRRFIETANAPIFGIDSKGLVNEWNQTSEKITGFKKKDVFGKNLVQTYITEDYRESVKKVLDDALHGEETANFEFPLFTKNGQRVMVLLNSSTRRDANGNITGVIGVGQDITELAGYRNELEKKVNERTIKLNKALLQEKELNELKSKFVSTASHEFRTPLSAINFAAGSIKKYWAKMEPIMIEKKLDKIEDQVVHMTKLLDDILIVGQADAGKFKNNPVHINFGNFIDEIIEEVYNSQKESHEILLIDTEGLKKSNIFIDEKLGRNIFINLISNAIKFSPNAKKVCIELASEKNYIIISIIDYGIGIHKSELKNIFQPFARGHNVDLIQGTGLGLSIAKEAIEAIEGQIIVNSTIGSGTSFIVKIPKKTK